MGDLLQAIQEGKANTGGREHTVDRVLSLLDESDRKDLLTALHDKDQYAPSVIVAVLAKRGHSVRRQHITSWRVREGIYGSC